MVTKIGNNGKDFASIPIRRIIDREELRDRLREILLQPGAFLLAEGLPDKFGFGNVFLA
jgi:hypothetical protein